jgi:hypothetical protein
MGPSNPSDSKNKEHGHLALSGVEEVGRQVSAPSIECQQSGEAGEHSMSDIAPKATGFNFIDNPHAPDIFVDAATGFFIFSHNMRITLETLRVSHTANPGPVSRLVIGRLVLPLEQAENLVKGILDMLQKHRSQPTVAQTSTTLQ